eukprot:403364938
MSNDNFQKRDLQEQKNSIFKDFSDIDTSIYDQNKSKLRSAYSSTTRNIDTTFFNLFDLKDILSKYQIKNFDSYQYDLQDLIQMRSYYFMFNKAYQEIDNSTILSNGDLNNLQHVLYYLQFGRAASSALLKEVDMSIKSNIGSFATDQNINQVANKAVNRLQQILSQKVPPKEEDLEKKRIDLFKKVGIPIILFFYGVFQVLCIRYICCKYKFRGGKIKLTCKKRCRQCTWFGKVIESYRNYRDKNELDYGKKQHRKKGRKSINNQVGDMESIRWNNPLNSKSSGSNQDSNSPNNRQRGNTRSNSLNQSGPQRSKSLLVHSSSIHYKRQYEEEERRKNVVDDYNKQIEEDKFYQTLNVQNEQDSLQNQEQDMANILPLVDPVALHALQSFHNQENAIIQNQKSQEGLHKLNNDQERYKEHLESNHNHTNTMNTTNVHTKQ